MIIPSEKAADILKDIVARVKNLKGGPGIRVSNGPGGITISLEPSKIFAPTPPSPTALSVGMYPGMVYQVTAANTAGWDWEHAHSIL